MSKEIPLGVQENAQLQLARTHYRYYLRLAHHGNYEPLRHTELIADELQRIIDGEQRHIIIEMPPRHGKSMSVTETFPSYYVGKNPDKKVITAAYSDSLSRGFGRLNRNKFAEFATSVFGLRISDDNGSVADWGVFNHTGGMVSTGIGGSITGKGADCLPAGTLIDTEMGLVDIKDLHEMKDKPKVLSMSLFNNALSYNSVKASREIIANEETTITTESGRKIISTPDHRHYEFGRGFKEAKDFKQGDYLTQKQNMFELWSREKWTWHVMQNMLSTKTWQLRYIFLRQLWEKFYEKEIRIRQKDKKWWQIFLLQQNMFATTSKLPITKKVFGMQRASTETNDEILFKRMSPECKTLSRNRMSDMQREVSTTIAQNSSLFEKLRKQSTQFENEGRKQFAIQGRNELCKMVFRNETIDIGTRQQPMCNLQSAEQNAKRQSLKSAHSSYRRKPIEQLCDEFNNAMQQMSYDTPQVKPDAVQSVRTISKQPYSVYDIQVEKDCNFFANGILVHNCLIIDDPIKNAKEAQSKTLRDSVWQEWESTLSTRLHKGASVIVIMTRWHEDDFVGRLLENSPYNWQRLRLPAVAEEDNDLLGREIGEPLSAELGFDKEWADSKKIEVGSRTWASLYQQRPAPAEGNIFNRAWFKFIDTVPARYDDLIISWDFAFKNSDNSDYVAGQVWQKSGANFYCIDQIHAQLDFTQSVQAVINLKNKYPRCRTILIEDKANGPAIINTLKQKVSGIIAITPRESKVARAYSVTPYFEAGNVYFKNGLPHLNDMVEELASFDNALHDDQVDAMTQALNYFAERPAANVIGVNAW